MTAHALAQVASVGTDEHGTIAPHPVADNDRDYFIERNGVRFAGAHLLVDLWDADGLDDPAFVEDALGRAARAAGATILYTHFHHFSPNDGVSGVIVLAESHISIHTWPERRFAAVDVFMCGGCEPHRAVDVMREAFRPGDVTLNEFWRGAIR